MGADQARLGALQVGEARPPHQRAIAENPEVLGGVIDAHHPSITTKSPICRSYGQNGAATEHSTSERPHSTASTWAGCSESRACRSRSTIDASIRACATPPAMAGLRAIGPGG